MLIARVRQDFVRLASSQKGGPGGSSAIGRSSNPRLRLGVFVRRLVSQAVQEIVGSVAGIKPSGLLDLGESCGFAEGLPDRAIERVSSILLWVRLHLMPHVFRNRVELGDAKGKASPPLKPASEPIPRCYIAMRPRISAQ